MFKSSIFCVNMFWLVVVVVATLQWRLKRTLRAAGDSLAHVNPRHHRQKLDVYNEVHKRIRKSNYEEANLPGFDDQLCLHFNRLPARYAIDVNVERAEDVLAHKRLLHLAEDPANRPVFEVRLVQVYPVSTTPSVDSVHSDSSVKEDAQSAYHSNRLGIHPPPTFGSSPHFEAFSIQATEDKDSAVKATSCLRTMHEITFSTVDRPKLLSQLTSLLAELGLNIQEAHAFSTVDGYSLDVFVVDGWAFEETEGLKDALEKEILKSKEQYYPIKSSISVMSGLVKEGVFSLPNCVEIPTDGTDVWEIDSRQLKLEDKIASGSYGDLYRGTYYSQEVAIKVLKPERVAGELLREFSQEVFIMRDLKTANLLMDENQVVKVTDFGVARVQTHSGVMTAETGTYRWMAPEVIEHKPYDHKADAFSFGRAHWELLTELPYSLDSTTSSSWCGAKESTPYDPKEYTPKTRGIA